MNKKKVVHLIYRLDIGGLERVMVNCINSMQSCGYEHIVVSLTDATEFSAHLNGLASIYELNKKPGKDLGCHWRLFRLLRQIKPDILHSYNLSAIEYHPIARLAGVKASLHAEHGRDSSDPQGLNKKHNLLRKLVSPFIDVFVPISNDLDSWLKHIVGIPSKKVKLILNGINTDAFYRKRDDYQGVHFIHVARFDLVKDQTTLLIAFAKLIQLKKLTPAQVRLTLVGDGQEKNNLLSIVNKYDIDSYVCFAGAQHNVPEWLANADVFVLSSIAEGIPMTVLEAMSARLPIITTRVGGLPEVVSDGDTGLIIEKQNIEELSNAMATYVGNKALIKEHGEKAQYFIEDKFSQKIMVSQYLACYDSISKKKGKE